VEVEVISLLFAIGDISRVAFSASSPQIEGLELWRKLAGV
jgi:hypothetical protein